MNRFLITALVLLFPLGANAQQSAAVCDVLAKHVPADNVIHVGNADLNPSPNMVPEVVKVPLEVDLAKRVAALTGKDIRMDAEMGMIEISKDGAVKYNGEDWTAPVMALCGQSYAVIETKEMPAPAVETPEAPVQAVPAPPPAEPIINQKQILNTTQIINRIPAEERAGEISVDPDAHLDRLPTADTIISRDVDDRMPERTMIDVRPTEAIPPQDVATEIKIKEPEIIEGGEYRDSHYNE